MSEAFWCHGYDFDARYNNITVIVVVFTQHVFQVVHVVRPDVLGASQHVRFAQQRPEVANVGVGHATVFAPDVAYVVYDLCVRWHRRRPLPPALKGPVQKHPSDVGRWFRRIHDNDGLWCIGRRQFINVGSRYIKR